MASLGPPEVKQEELIPNLNTYVRGKLSKSEVLNFADCARALASATNTPEGKDVLSKALPRLTLFGALPPSILPILLQVRGALDVPKNPDRKLLRLVHYLIQLASSDGSAGTCVPFSPLLGQARPVRATDQFDVAFLQQVFGDAAADNATTRQRIAAFRQLAALSRASLSSNPDDLSLVRELLSAAATTLDRVEAARRRKAPSFLGQNKKTLEVERRAGLERLAVQRAALSAARVGLPPTVLSSKIAPRAYSGINSPDALCARHALAVAALVAQESPATYARTLEGLLRANVEVFKATGNLAAGAEAAVAAAPISLGAAGPVPGRPSKDLFQERTMNLTDPWARVYLARGCGAVIHSSYIGGNVNSQIAAPFWSALTIMATCDKSTIVAMEAIKALAGAPYPSQVVLRPSAGRRPPALDEAGSQEVVYGYATAWQMLLLHANDPSPGKDPTAPAAASPQPPGAATAAAAAAAAALDPLAAAAARFTAARSQRGLQPSASLRRLASMQGAEAGGGGGGGAGSGGGASGAPTPLFSAIVQRISVCLGQMSHAAACAACRAVAALAEARGHALAAARSAEARAALLGDDLVQSLMLVLEERMISIASDPGFAPHTRELALEALLWLQPLPLLPPGAQQEQHILGLTAADLVEWVSTGGGTTTATVRVIFADPWPEDVLTSFLATLSRRLLSCPAAAEYLLGLGSALARMSPSRVRPELLHQMWDTCLRANNQAVKLAAIRAALDVMRSLAPPIAQPPSAAAPEVKALASKEEMGMVALVRAATWWLGENANFGSGEFAWKARSLPLALLETMDAAPGPLGQETLAAAAAAANPVLLMVLAHLQRAMVAAPWEVRSAAAQGIAKIAVRAGEPFRVQCYALLAAAMPQRRRGGGGSAGSASGACTDPLGVAACVGPALEVLDNLYAAELVGEELLARFGSRRKAWPKEVLEAMAARSDGLVAAVCERVAFVPRDLFTPLGPRVHALLAGKDETEDEEEGEEEVEGGDEDGQASTLEEEAQQRYYSEDGEEEDGPGRQKSIAAKLKGYDYDPDKEYEDAFLPGPEESGGEGGGSDDDSDIVVQYGMVLYDFGAEEEDEVAVARGERVEVLYEVAGWLQVATRAGARGLVPKSYVQLEGGGDEGSVLSGGGGGLSSRASSVYSESQVTAAAEYNSFLERSRTVTMSPSAAAAAGGSFRRRSSLSGASVGGGGFGRSSYPGGGRSSFEDEGRAGEEEDVAPMALASMMARVHDATAELAPTIAQVEALDASTRSGSTFNQPQYLHLKEALNSSLAALKALQVAGEARTARRQARERALTALDRLEYARRFALSGGGGGGSPGSTLSGGVGGGGGGGRASTGSWGGGDVSALDLAVAPPEAGGEEAYAPIVKARVAFAFAAEAEGELSVAEGEALVVEEEVDGWYSVVRESDGTRGLVPASYVELLE